VADDAALYFADTFEDCRQPCVAPVAFYPPLCGVAIAVMSCIAAEVALKAELRLHARATPLVKIAPAF
jgi:hypothetical protein